MKFLSISFLFLLAMSCNSNTQSTPSAPSSNKRHIGKVSKADFTKKMTSINEPQLIDVRTPKEYNAGHLDGAINIDYRSKNFNEEIGKIDKKRPVFVYCKSGGRSGKSTSQMEKMGFEEVYDLEGGYDGWNQ